MAHYGIEKEINQLLRSKSDLEMIADEFIKRWHRFELAPSEQLAVANFLLNANFIPSLLDSIAKNLEKNRNIPWAQLIECLAQIQNEHSEKEILQKSRFFFDPIFQGAHAQNKDKDLVVSAALDSYDPRFQRLRKQVEEEGQAEYEKEKEKLLRQVSQLEQDRLWDAQATVIQKLMNKWPEDENIQSLEHQFRQKLAAKKFSTSPEDLDKGDILEKRWIQKSQEDIIAEENIGSALVALASKNPNLAYEIAIALHSMDLHSDGLEALAFSPENESTVWLRLDLQLAGGNFVLALTYADKLLENAETDPEAVYSALYAKARALYGLNRLQDAISVLTSLVENRPSFRSSHSLLLKWQEELR